MNNNNSTIANLNLLAQILNCVKFFRFVFFFYAFISFVFWFLNCLEVDWLYLFNWLFVIPYQFVILFYKPEGISADFTLAIIGGSALIIGFIIEFISNSLYQKLLYLKEKEEKRIMQERMKRRKLQAQRLNAHQNAAVEMGNNIESANLLFLISPHIAKIKRNEDDLDLTFQEVEIWKQRINKKILENLNYSKPLQKGYYRKNLFFIYKDFNYVDDFVYYLNPTLDSIILEFKKYGIFVSYCYVLSSIVTISNLEKELDCMDTILSLNFTNETIVTNRFKITYDNKNNPNYLLSLRGEYNLSKNLSISNRQPLYSLKDRKTKGV